MLAVAVALLATSASTAHGQNVPISKFESTLQQLASQMSTKWNMSVAISFYSESAGLGFSHDAPGLTSVAAGFTDAGMGMGKPTRPAKPDDKYVWGSITKMFTGPAVLQLVSKGVIGLDDPITKHVDPLLRSINGTTLEDALGPAVAAVKVWHLLHMVSGLHDYDGEKYAEAQFANRTRDFSPVEIVGGYVRQGLSFPPGTSQSYCSTGYILLGLALANHLGGGSWQGYDQLDVIPAALRAVFPDSLFVNKGTCEDNTPVHGFLEGYSTASIPRQDVWNVSCAGGWTAGNYVGSVGDVARYTYDLYNLDDPRIVDKEQQARMINFTSPNYHPKSGGFKFYGMGTFNLDWSIGAPVGFPGFPTPHQTGNYTAYGHVGDTYGYQSQTTYFPEHDFVLTVATNIETDSQAQPAEATCLGYHTLVPLFEGKPPNPCNFTVPSHFIGVCSCEQP